MVKPKILEQSALTCIHFAKESLPPDESVIHMNIVSSTPHKQRHLVLDVRAIHGLAVAGIWIGRGQP